MQSVTFELVAIVTGFAVQLMLGGFWAGRLTAKVAGIDDRLSRVESWIGDKHA